LVRSRFLQSYANNVSSLFDECYNLASTQQRKNKDLPEGGSKGVILLGLTQQVGVLDNELLLVTCCLFNFLYLSYLTLLLMLGQG
jgi:NAD-specific glutamate dehydrogenase